MKAFFVLALVVAFSLASIAVDCRGLSYGYTRGYGGGKSYGRSYSGYSKSSYKPTRRYTSGSTYKVHSSTYCSTCARSNEGKIKRSEFAKKEFLKSKGYNKVPQGYQVDHINPLYKGGSDTPSNMQLIPTGMHKEKTASERKY